MPSRTYRLVASRPDLGAAADTVEVRDRVLEVEPLVLGGPAVRTSRPFRD